MIIDFHTHVFPEEIAGKTIQKLSKCANVKANTNGTLKDLKKSMRESGVDFSVILPVVTKPSSFDSINRYAALISNERGILSFAGIHQEDSHIIEQLNYIKESGFKGIKLHPDYQGTDMDTPQMKRLIYRASELGLIISVHAGIDIGMPDHVHCTPMMAGKIIKEVRPEKLVLAHFGGWKMWEEVERHLIGENVYLDTAFTLEYLDEKKLVTMAQEHGTDKVLFATDSPWSSQEGYVKRICNMPFSEAQKKQILSENAKRLLDIQ